MEAKKDKIRRELKELGVRILEKEEVEAKTRCECEFLGAGTQGSCTRTVDPRTHQQVLIKNCKDKFKDLVIEAKNQHQLQMPGVQRLMGVCRQLSINHLFSPETPPLTTSARTYPCLMPPPYSCRSHRHCTTL